MRVKSIGWQTDLTLRRLEGAEIVEGEEHLVVRSAENPGFWWGNFILVDAPPKPGDADRWIGQFNAAFPDAGHVAIGIDSPSGQRGAIEELAALGMRTDVYTVLSTATVRRPSREPPAATFRRVASDGDWRKATDLWVANDDLRDTPGHREFVKRRLHAARRVCEQGHGAWFGAFREGEMHAGLGIFRAGPGLARFQAVDTHPAHRRQGLASHLLFTAGQYALTELGASTLLIYADPEYHAIGIYRSLGFSDREQHVQLERPQRQTQPARLCRKGSSI